MPVDITGLGHRRDQRFLKRHKIVQCREERFRELKYDLVLRSFLHDVTAERNDYSPVGEGDFLLDEPWILINGNVSQ